MLAPGVLARVACYYHYLVDSATGYFPFVAQGAAQTIHKESTFASGFDWTVN